ncbi:MAG: RNA-binding protein, partial [Candidatus Diapherotrites archaeon]|nr:RNA-binding protein [Candidatus Diapherotrites archaeon]
IKMGLEKPYADSPGRGNLITNIELNALAAPEFESGPPREDAIELSRVVDRVIRESEFIDFNKLCITEGELVWVVFADVRVLNYDGNLFDACALAVAAALKTAKIPVVKDDRVVTGEWTKNPLPLTTLATLSTFYKIGDSIVLDAALNEDKAFDARVSVGVTESGDLCALQKGGVGSFSLTEMEKILTDDALKASKALLKELKSQVKG